MQLMHEAVKVSSLSLGKGQAVAKQVHQPRLAATDTAPQIEPAHGRLDSIADATEPTQRSRALALSGDQLAAKPIQMPNGTELCRIRLKATLCNLLGIGLLQTHHVASSSRLRKCSSACGFARASTFLTGCP